MEPPWTSKPEPVVGKLIYFCQKTWATPLWIFNPCASMSVGHQVRTSCLHQQEPGAESHQKRSSKNEVNKQRPSGRGHQSRSRIGHSSQNHALLLLPENLGYPPPFGFSTCVHLWALGIKSKLFIGTLYYYRCQKGIPTSNDQVCCHYEDSFPIFKT
jgi:hypothetical protein